MERFYEMFGRNAFTWLLAKRGGKWGGSCFGFSSTVALFTRSIDSLRIQDFMEGANVIWDLRTDSRNEILDMSVMHYLELMQISQYSRMFSSHAQ